jgi:large conductance mechanosensitive channel
MLKDFRDFVTRGNVLDLAVAVVLGAAFGAVVTAVVEGLVMPLIAALFGQPNFDAMFFEINDTKFLYGTVLTAIVNFLLIALAIFFFIVKPVTSLTDRLKQEEESTERDCPECTKEVSVDAKRCPYCTSELTPAG